MRDGAPQFASRPDVVYVRTPSSVSVNKDWGQAAESGRWIGRWTRKKQTDSWLSAGNGWPASAGVT